MLSPQLIDRVHNPTSVTSEYAASTSQTSIHQVAERLYPHGPHHVQAVKEQIDSPETSKLDKVLNKLHLGHDSANANDNKWAHQHGQAWDQWERMKKPTAEELEIVKTCGQWGSSTPSELFLTIYAQTLIALEDHPLKGMVSPSLMASSGVIPLTIVSVIPDIIQHHADVIVRAEHEIFLATNYWEASSAAKTITDAFKELSRRVMEAKREPVVVKLMYDRGNPHQVVEPHQRVPEETYTGDKVKLPHPDEIPGIRLEVQNYHQPPVGTFHAKYMVVDRKIAILNSNNIQDRVNVEMMCHIEGPIVQGFYDLALLSWSNDMDPRLPLLSSPPTYPTDLNQSHFSFGTAHPIVSDKGNLEANAEQSRQTLKDYHAFAEEHLGKWDQSNGDEAQRVDSQFSDATAITSHLNTGTKITSNDDTPLNTEPFRPVILHCPHNPVPMALVCRPPRGKPGHGDTFVPQDQAFLAGFKFAKSRVFIQTPTFNAWPVVQAALDAVRRGILVEIYADLGFNDEGELLPFQGGTNEMISTQMYGSLEEAEKARLKIYWYTGKDQKTPLNAKHKSRNCHVKLMIIDESVIIQGNGNQDTQSWFHSQEVNAMTDSPLLAKEIRQGIDANQNTKFYGLVDPKDGQWRDANGQLLPGTKPPPKGPLKSLVGVKGAIQRVRGEGGF